MSIKKTIPPPKVTPELKDWLNKFLSKNSKLMKNLSDFKKSPNQTVTTKSTKDILSHKGFLKTNKKPLSSKQIRKKIGNYLVNRKK